jgi:hypothetical protein
METLWNSYGILMEQHADNTPAARSGGGNRPVIGRGWDAGGSAMKPPCPTSLTPKPVLRQHFHPVMASGREGVESA